MANPPAAVAPLQAARGLAIRLLGEFSVSALGRSIELPTRASQSLFAYLCLTSGTAHRREHLAGLLWPDSTETNARNNLRVALWRARKSVEGIGGVEGRITASEKSIALRLTPDDWVDARYFDGPLNGATSEQLLEAAAAYGGDLLPGFYEDWVILERQRLQAGFEVRMTALLEQLAADRRWPDIRLWGERWIALGQTPEPAYRALMVAHAGLNDMSRVAAVYRRCVESLQAELGVSPAAETTALFKWLTEGGDPAAGPGPAIADLDGPTSVAASNNESPAPGEPPFMGLRSYDEADSERFFGRSSLTSQLVERLGNLRFLAIVGASGSGKSSIVRAGLVPALRWAEPGLAVGPASRPGPIVVVTPTESPLAALAAALLHSSARPSDIAHLREQLAADPAALCKHVHRRHRGPFVLVVDQLEELFTLARDADERSAYLRLLTHVVGRECRHDTRVVIVLRADFYEQCASDAALRDALAANQAFIGRMTAVELRQAVESPATRNGWSFEPGLVDLVLRDVGREPGGLPLLSHALLETWHRRRGRVLTLRGYAESGGVRGAIARSADRLFNQRLSPADQLIARRILLRLTELGSGSQATRRRAPLSELIGPGDEGSAANSVLGALVDARLVVVTRDAAEVAHEALITHWPALSRWLADDREGLRLHRHLTEAAQSWEGFERDADQLYRGALLAKAIEWAADHDADLNALERTFLDASKAAAVRERSELAARQQHELEIAQRLAQAEGERAEAAAAQAATEREATRRLRRRAVYLAAALVVSVGLGIVAGLFERDAQQSAEVAVANAVSAEAANRIAQSREVAAAAIASLDFDPERGILLALQANAIDPTLEAEDALHRSVGASRVLLTMGNPRAARAMIGTGFSPDGKLIVTGIVDATAVVWDAATGREIEMLTGHDDAVNGAAFSPDGRLIATASDDHTARTWDVATGRLVTVFRGHSDQVARAVFSPDGRRLATGAIDGTARVWDVTTGQSLITLSGPSNGIRDVTWSPDGTRIATADRDGTARVWDATDGAILLELVGHTQGVLGVAYAPDGATLATASSDGTAAIWDATTGERLRILSGHTANVQGIAFSPDGRWVATSSYDTTARIWDARTGVELIRLAGHTGPIYGLAFAPDGARLVTVSEDGTARVWTLQPVGELPILKASADGLWDAVFSPTSGSTLATVGTSDSPAIWNTDLGRQAVELNGHVGEVYSAAFSPDGRRLATAGADRTARIWNVATGAQELVLDGHQAPATPNYYPGVLDVAFSPDGGRLATAGDDGTARIWDTGKGRELVRLVGHDGPVGGVAFSPDGSRLATAGWDQTAIIWDAFSGKRLMTLSGHSWIVRRVAFSPDGSLLATASFDGTAKLWNAASGQLLKTLSGHTALIFSAAFSPDGARIATASFDGTAKVWSVETGEELLTLRGPSEGDASVAFSPDGRRLLVASRDGLVRTYLMDVDDLVALARSRVTRIFTTEECRKYLHLDDCSGSVTAAP